MNCKFKTAKCGYNEHALDRRLVLFVISVIRYNRKDLSTNLFNLDQKLHL